MYNIIKKSKMISKCILFGIAKLQEDRSRKKTSHKSTKQ